MTGASVAIGSGAEMARKDESIPGGRWSRTAKVGSVIGSQGARYAGTRAANVVRSKERGTEALDARHLEAAERMVDALGSLKGAAMKIGQLASFIDTEFLPPEYRELYQDKLADLRTSAPPMAWKKVKSVLEDEWEDPVEELFEDFEHDSQNQRTFARAYRGHPFIHVPDVVTRLSRSRVMVSEWVDGMGFEEVKGLPQDERDRFGEIVFRFCFGSIYHLQHFNADT